MMLRAAHDPEIVTLGQLMGEQICDGLCALLEHKVEIVQHPRPFYAIRFLVFTFLSVLESRVLFPIDPLFSNEELISEFKCLAMAYLGISNPDAKIER